MDIIDQIHTYFATPDDLKKGEKGEAQPSPSGGNTVIPLIDGRSYFEAIRKLLIGLGSGPNVSKQFFYTSNWFLHLAKVGGEKESGLLIPGINSPISPTKQVVELGPPFKLKNDTTEKTMAELLAEKSALGVDVRVMVWANPALFTQHASEKVGYFDVNVSNIYSIDDLRNRVVKGAKPMALRACILTIGHLLGAMHMKMVVAHDGTKAHAFVSGIDFYQNRDTDETHKETDKIRPWHDMGVSIEGPAVEDIYNFYRSIWNEQLLRSPVQQFLLDGKRINAVEKGTDAIPARSVFPKMTPDKHWVQVACTLPQFHFAGSKLPFFDQPLKAWPDGLFQVVVARRKAILNATQYIYIEDPEFRSHDVMDWLNEAIRKNDNLKVILLKGTEQDPIDKPISTLFDSATVEAIIKHLVGLKTSNELKAHQIARIGLFLRKNRLIHAKVTIIDDHWLFIGSANISRRSLYTDGEISVAVLDSKDELAKMVRVKLWGEHFGKTGAERAKLADLEKALGVWKRAWGLKAPYSLTTDKNLQDLIFEQDVLSLAKGHTFSQAAYDRSDPDSRQTFDLLALLGSS